MYKVLHPTDYVDVIYVSRKGGRVLTSIMDCVEATMREFEECIVFFKRHINLSGLVNASLREE